MATGTIKQVIPNSGTGYCKMPDGTLICWGTATKAVTEPSWSSWNAGWYQVTVVSGNSITFPVAFIATPRIYATISSDVWASVVSVGGDAAHIGRIAVARPSQYAGTLQCDWLAIGRWK